MGSNSEIQGYNFYPILHFHRKFSSGVTSLQVIGVGFQLYGQLKKSPHDSTGVLGSTVVSIVSQATKLGKSSSVTV